MDYHYIVKYKFINDNKIYESGVFYSFSNAMHYRGEILKKYKNKLEYCIYEKI